MDTFCIKITKIVYKERDFNLLIIEIESIEVLENKNKKKPERRDSKVPANRFTYSLSYESKLRYHRILRLLRP